MEATTAGPIQVFQQRNFRVFWIGFLISNAGAWIQAVAQAWLVYEISGSAVWLGAVGFVRSFPLIILSMVGGTVADRVPKQRILYVTQSIMVLVSLSLGTLTYLGVIQVWHVLVLTALSGTAQAFDQPARNSLVPSLVPKEHLHRAISLNAIAFNGAAAFGPSLTGLIVPLIGLAGCFFLNALTFGAVFTALALMKFPENPGRSAGRQSMGRDLADGLRMIFKTPVVLALISMAGVNSFFARPFQQFITVFARDVHGGDVGLAGMMQAAPAVGTIIFMLLISSTGHIQRKGGLLLAAGFGFGLSLIAFAWAPTVWLALPLLVLVGGFNMTYMTTTNTLLQTNVDDAMRGRVMASYTITALAMMPLGQGPMGWSMELFGPRLALTIGGLISLVWIGYMALIRVPSVRRLP